MSRDVIALLTNENRSSRERARTINRFGHNVRRTIESERRVKIYHKQLEM